MMIAKKRSGGTAGRGLRCALVALVGAGASGCEGILDVELPGQIVEGALFDPAQAPILVASAIGDIECAYSEFIASDASGVEDVFLRVTGWWGGSFEYRTSPNTVGCNTAENAYGWWSPLQAGRFMAEQTYQQINGWTDQQVPNRQRLLAQSAIYAGVAYNLLGDYFCEVAVDGGNLMNPDQTLGEAERWLTSAIGHIGATDFAMPASIGPSARQMAHLLRARVRFSRGDHAGAAADARMVTPGFVAYATREAGGERKRWNRVFNAHNGSGWGTVMGAVDWWRGPGDWPAVIPFTGYRNLGVLPDGRAVSDTGHPITTTGAANAVADTRVRVRNTGRIFNNFPSWVQEKYTSLGSPIPLANWQEAWLILAEVEGGQGAIDRVNAIRAASGLPPVTYLSASDAAGIERMIIEERRRSLFLEGRFWTTKLQKNLWFPRGVGTTPYPYSYQLAVRMVMPTNAFELNRNFDRSAEATLCGSQRPAL